MRKVYAGYVIDATPLQRRDSEEWTVNITVERHYGDRVETRSFSAGTPTFKNLEDAQQASLDFGRRIINGEFKDLSVSDM